MINAEILKQLDTTEEMLVEHLERATREVFSTMVGADISTPQKTTPVKRFKNCVTAMVGFAGIYNGMISINTPQKLAMAFASSMLGTKIRECDDEVHDALGEIANMIAGSFKHHFVRDGHEVRLSTPSVISGQEYVMTVGSLTDTLTLGFQFGKKHFSVSVYLETGE